MGAVSGAGAAAVLDAAFVWLCQRRRAWPADADIWSFRHDRPHIKAALLTCRFRFAMLRRIITPDGSEADLWSARDALVLKGRSSCSLGLMRAKLPVSPVCAGPEEEKPHEGGGQEGKRGGFRDGRCELRWHDAEAR